MEGTIGEDAVNVHQQQTDAGGALKKFGAHGQTRNVGAAVIDRVLKTISRYSMLGPASPSGVGPERTSKPAGELAADLPSRPIGIVRVAVAVSGGPDSVCLLHILTECAPRLGIALSVAHYNHKLRGAASDEDQRFVAGMAARMGLALHCEEAGSKPLAGNLEQSARDARRAFFARLVNERAADRIALGHTRDDQAETVLFRILRGSGPGGLAGILPVTTEGCIRPLLEVTRADVEQYLNARGIDWRVDATNLEHRFARNRIRHGLLPQLAREWNPNISEALAQLAGLAYDEERWWRGAIERRAAACLTERAGAVEFHAAEVAALPLAVARRLIRRAIAGAKGDLRRIDFAHVERVLELVAQDAGEGAICLPDVQATRSFDWIRIASLDVRAIARDEAVTVPGSGAVVEGGPLVAFEIGERSSTPCATLEAAELNLEGLPTPVRLRGWRPGDQYRPVGQRKDRKIHDLFQQARVPSWRRADWPIVTGGKKILWASRFGAAAQFAAGAGPGPVLRIFDTGAKDR